MRHTALLTLGILAAGLLVATAIYLRREKDTPGNGQVLPTPVVEDIDTLNRRVIGGVEQLKVSFTRPSPVTAGATFGPNGELFLGPETEGFTANPILTTCSRTGAAEGYLKFGCVAYLNSTPGVFPRGGHSYFTIYVSMLPEGWRAGRVEVFTDPTDSDVNAHLYGSNGLPDQTQLTRLADMTRDWINHLGP